MKAAAVQLNSTEDRDRNLATAERLVREASANGAELVVLPEKWTVLGPAETQREHAEPLDGPAITAARSWAAELGVTLVAGSIGELLEGEEKFANTSVVIDPEGEISAVYRKIHMFDVDVGGVAYRESDSERPGDEIVLTDVAGDPPVKLGLSVCYDLRFPELYRALAVGGARVITVPAAFTTPTGRDHWEVLLRARAIEDQVFVIAPNQVGKAPPHWDSYGHSMIVDPWGRILAEAEEGAGEEVIVAEIDLDEEQRIRDSLPSLANRRPEVYA
jgi:predicted amidohydrolase